MPNHVQNILTFGGSDEAVNELVNFIKGNNPNDEGKSFIDFNVIVPMPSELDVEESTAGETAMKYLKLQHDPNRTEDFEEVKEKVEGWSEEDREEYMKLGRAYIKNLRLYGARTWYDWKRIHWGTKWNAYWATASDDKREIWFNTAWSAPFPIVEAIARKFPNVTIDLLYADEDAGYNVGHVTFEDGECVDEYLPDGGSDEAMRIYFATHPADEDYYVKDENGNWTWKFD